MCIIIYIYIYICMITLHYIILYSLWGAFPGGLRHARGVPEALILHLIYIYIHRYISIYVYTYIHILV